MCKADEQLRTEPQNWKLFTGGLLHLTLAPRPPLHCATVPMRARLFSYISFPCHFFQGSTDNVFLALIINLTCTFVPVCALQVSAPFPSYTAEEPGSLPSLFSVSHFEISRGPPVDRKASTIQQLNSFEPGRRHYRFILHSSVSCNVPIKIAKLLVNIAFQINSQPENSTWCSDLRTDGPRFLLQSYNKSTVRSLDSHWPSLPLF